MDLDPRDKLPKRDRLNKRERARAIRKLSEAWQLMSEVAKEPLQSTYGAFENSLQRPKNTPSSHKPPCPSDNAHRWSKHGCSREALVNLLGCLDARTKAMDAYAPLVTRFCDLAEDAAEQRLNLAQIVFLRRMVVVVLNVGLGHLHQLTLLETAYEGKCDGDYQNPRLLGAWDMQLIHLWQLYQTLESKLQRASEGSA